MSFYSLHLVFDPALDALHERLGRALRLDRRAHTHRNEARILEPRVARPAFPRVVCDRQHARTGLHGEPCATGMIAPSRSRRRASSLGKYHDAESACKPVAALL